MCMQTSYLYMDCIFVQVFWSCYDPRHYASGSFVLDISLVYLSVVTAIGEQV